MARKIEWFNEKLSTNEETETMWELFNLLNMSDEELAQRQKSRQKETEIKLIEEHIYELPEEEKSDYQRLKWIENLAKVLWKKVPQNVKKKLEQYRDKVAKMIGIINEEESEDSKISKDLELSEFSECPQDLKDARELWEKEIRDISDESKEKIFKAAEKIPVKVEKDIDGNKLIEFSLNGKKYKILDPDLVANSDRSFLLVDVAGHEWMIWDDVEQWKNQKLKEYVKQKQLEWFHIPNIEEMKNLLDKLWNLANLHEEKDKIAMLMYLTGMNWAYWLSMSDKKSRQILFSDTYNSTWFYDNGYESFYARLCMIACD